MIPRNYGNGPGFFSLNLRLAKTWGFGEHTSGSGGSGGMGGGSRGDGTGGRGGGGGRRGGNIFGSGDGMGSIFGGGSTGQRYQLTLSVMARNLLNDVNDGDYIGNLTSPYFGQANSLNTGFGGGGAVSTNNRRIELGLRFTF